MSMLLSQFNLLSPSLPPTPVSTYLLGKRRPGTPKECLTGFNGETLLGGVPGPDRGRSRKSARPDHVRSLFIYSLCEGWLGLVYAGLDRLLVLGVPG